jgi:phosphatidylglycerol---prolipoprotein diacylglyceryl transferase
MTLGSVLTAAGYLIGLLVFYLAARQRGLATEGMRHVALAGLCGGVLGAKLTEWGLGHWQTLAAHPGAMLDPRLGGRTIIGGVLAGWLAVEVAKWRLGIRRSTGDLFALALPAGEAVGRIGCFFNGCCYGVPSHVPWAVYQHGAWRHPAQLYAALIAAAIFGTLFALRNRICDSGRDRKELRKRESTRKREKNRIANRLTQSDRSEPAGFRAFAHFRAFAVPFGAFRSRSDRMQREGDLFKLYLVLYGVSRFGLEFLRERNLAFGGLSLAQWVCLEIAVVAWLALDTSRRRVRSALSLER